MCGLIGVLSTETTNGSNRRDFFEQGLLASQLRGTDGTGLFTMSYPVGKRWEKSRNKEDLRFFLYKRGLKASDFIETKLFKEIMNVVEYSPILIGHTRAKTRAEMADENAHPFVYHGKWGKVALVHNGYVHNHDKLPSVITKEGPDYEVDSMSITHSIGENGPVEVIKKMQGAYGLIFVNKETKTVYMTCNGERELHFCFVKGQNTMLIASEKIMLEWLAYRNNMKPDGEIYYITKTIEKVKGPEPDIEKIPLFAFNLDNLRDYANHPETQTVGRDLWTTHRHNNPVVPYAGRGGHVRPLGGMGDGDIDELGYPYTDNRMDNEEEWSKSLRNVYSKSASDEFLDKSAAEAGDWVGFIPLSAYHEHKDRTVIVVQGIMWSIVRQRWYQVAAYMVPRESLESVIERTVGDSVTFVRNTTLYGTIAWVSHSMFQGQITNTSFILQSSTVGDVDKADWNNMNFYFTQEETIELPGGGKLHDKVPGPEGEIITKEEYLKLVHPGCYLCNMSISLLDAREIKWETVDNRFEPICEICAEQYQDNTGAMARGVH